MLASWLVAWARIRLQRTSRRIELGGKVNGAQASQHGQALELPQPASASNRQTSVSSVQALLATLARFTDAVSRVCGSQQLALERARATRGEPPPVALVLPEHVAKRDAPVRTHDLRSYDRQPDRPAERQPDLPSSPPETADE